METAPFTDLITPDLRVCLLGTPRIEWAGQSFVIPRRQTRALLFYLATRLQGIPRDHLHLLLWPDWPESLARRHLTRSLSHLRRALPAPEILIATEEEIRLDPHRVWSDTAYFEWLYATRNPSRRIEALRQAASLYRGPFLDGFSLPNSEFEAWSLQERSCFERLYLDALETLLQDRADQRAYDEAIAYAQRYLKSDELAETVHRHLIELYVRTGNRSAALRQYESCVVALERELGVSPLPETQAAYQAALHDRPLVQLTTPPTWTTFPSLNAPLIGRGDALTRLQRAYAQAESGLGAVILVSGEPGIGKSRLLQEFVSSLQDKATLVVGDGHEAEQGFPYWPLIEALRPHVQSIDWARLDLEPHYLSEVARILPELRRLVPECPAALPVEPGQAQGRLFQALALVIESWAAQSPPLMLCLDDLHWADTATLTWLGYLSRRIKSVPILILGAYRTEEATAVATLRAEVARQGILQEIALEGLPAPEVLHLIQHLAGQASGVERLGQCLHRETGGNPFFLLETLRALFETGSLWQDETGWQAGLDEATDLCRELPLPNTIYEAIRNRLGRLRPGVRQVLEAGAVLGYQFDLDTLRMTSGRRESEVVNAVDELLARQVISEHDSAYRFNHDLIRTVVYLDLSYGRQRLLHRRAGQALLKLRPDDPVALAWHFERAEELGRAAEYALRAGQQAKIVFAYEQARTCFDRTLSLLEREAATLRAPDEIAANQRRRIRALDERGWVLRLLGDMEAYARDSQEIARLAQVSDDQHSLAHLRLREASTHRWFCRYAQALAAAEEGIRLSRTARDRALEVMCQREVGLTLRETGDYVRARSALEHTLHLAEALHMVSYQVHVLGNLSTLYLDEGQYGEAMEMARQALALCDQAELPLERRLPLGDMGAVAAATGDNRAARSWLLESLEIARKTADRTQEIFCRGHLGWLSVRLEQPKQALEHLQAALALAEAIDSRTEQSWLHSGLAEASQLDGNTGLAQIHAQQALKLALAYGRPYDERIARQVLATL